MKRQDAPFWPVPAGVAIVLAILHWPAWAIVSAELAVRAVWAYTHAFRDCWACNATGRNGFSTKRRWGKCWRCRGRREIRAVDARLLHWTVRKLGVQVSEWRQR